MAPLSKSNKYLKDRSQMVRIVKENAVASAIFEGASPRIAEADQPAPDKRKATASSKKRVRSS